MGRFDNYGEQLKPEVLAKRQEVIDKSLASFDPATATELDFRWDGEYYFRILPLLDLETMRDLFAPRGWHWRLSPTAENEKVSLDGCPEFTWGEECPVCNAIRKVVAEKQGEWKEFNGQNTIGVQKEMLLRILLTKVKNLKPKGQQKPPVWREGELPLVKVGVFKRSAVKTLNGSYIENEDYGLLAVTHPKTGTHFKLIHDSTKEGTKQYEIVTVPGEYPIPEEFLEDEAVEAWPNPIDLLPKPNTEELYKLIEQHQMDMDPRIVNAVLAIDAELGGGHTQKTLPAGSNEEEAPAEPAKPKGKGINDLKKKLADRSKK